MRRGTTAIATIVFCMTVAASHAMMGGGATAGHGQGHGHGQDGGNGMGPAMTHPAGPGFGMAGAGGLKTGLLGGTMRHAFPEVLAPLATAEEAAAAVQNFISAAGSSLQVSEVWEYGSAFKAELADAAGQKAFDVLADKLTGTVTPEMGVPMMMNASWGKQLHATPKFAKKLALTAADAVAAAETFVSRNAGVLDYTLAAPETYPGFYKFHTTDASGAPGIDIMVNGYSGSIWMNTQLGPPIRQVP